MKLYNSKTYSEAKTTEMMQMKCDYCNNPFLRSKFHIQRRMTKPHKLDFCNRKCASLKHRNGQTTTCKHCGCSVYRNLATLSKFKNAFCNQSCAALFNNSNRTLKGNGVSKLEHWLQEKLLTSYPTLEFHFNRNDTINSQLDIYIPLFKLAFELNGPFHYEPIFGKEQLDRIQNNDQRKFQACLEKGIELCVIDSSKQKYFKEHTSQPFLAIIVNIINLKLKSEYQECPIIKMDPPENFAIS